MKTSQKGFISPLLLALVAVLLVGGGVYVYVENKQAGQSVSESSVTQTDPTIKGWLEGNRDNWILVETTKSLSGYSGSRFALKFSNKSNCVSFDNSGDFISFLCLSDATSTPNWGVGDRVRVTGKVGVNDIEVVTMEIVSSLQVASW